eukprot:1450490-Rhodomonas_salina.2
MNKLKRRGLRHEMVRLVLGSHVTLFIQGMKNDTTGNGMEIVMGWVSGSGVRIGEVFLQLEALLDRSGIPLDRPLFCATRNSADGGFKLPEPGCKTRFQGILLDILPRVYVEFADKAMLHRFTWHSLRRGGASWAWNQGVQRQLVMGQGSWRSEGGF